MAIPAHDEVAEIGPCLDHVARAVAQATESGACTRVSIVVASHRCTDETAERAEAVLADVPGEHRVLRDQTSRSVGQVRSGMVVEMVGHTTSPPDEVWLLSTDADSHVPPTWITGMLSGARDRGAVAAAGLVSLRDWLAPAPARARYAAIIEAGLAPTGHAHVYGANLAVRLDAYLRVGGFRDVHAEDQDLVDRLRAAGEPVAALSTPVVSTSARHDGRAEGGLSALLGRLVLPAVAELG